MSDGAKESIEGDNLSCDSDIFGGNDFVREVSKIAVAQICDNVGFQSCFESAIDELGEIALRYISDLALASISSANSAGRTQCNVFDLFNGMRNLSRRTLGISEILGQIEQYSTTIDEQLPFSHQIPPFPILQNPPQTPSFSRILEIPPSKHIPPWLPAFPDPHTHIHTPMWTSRNTDPREEKIEQAKQRRKAEKSLLRLQKRLLSAKSNASDHLSSFSETNKLLTSTASPSSPELLDRHERTSTVAENPFLLPPFKGGTTTSELVLPARFTEAGSSDPHPVLHHGCELNGTCHESELERRPLPEKRGKILFRLTSGKMRKSVDQELCKNRALVVKIGSENKKRRAVEIVRESIENSDELTQL